MTGQEVRARAEWSGRRVAIELSGRVRSAAFIDGLADPGPRIAEVTAPVGLIPAMARGVPLVVEGWASDSVRSGVEVAQRALAAWCPQLSRVPVRADADRSDLGVAGDRSAGAAAFFSGGVDSFDTLLANRDQLTHLIFVHGFDLDLSETGLRERASLAARAVAGRFGLRLLEVRTDLRRLLEPELTWPMSHGVALAAVALAAQAEVGRVLIPASYSHASMFPWGSHPLLDPLWSTEGLEIVHDGFERERNEKIARIASDETALAYLRVCWENRGGAYNCGRCEKCVRTMIGLAAAGALERCSTFPGELTAARVRRLEIVDDMQAAFARQNLESLEAGGHRPEITAALRTSLRRSRGFWGLARRVRRRLRIARRRWARRRVERNGRAGDERV